MSKICQITGKKVISGNNVSHSHRKTKRRFYPNLFKKKYFLEEENKWITLIVSAHAMKIIKKTGIVAALKKAKSKGYINKF